MNGSRLTRCNCIALVLLAGLSCYHPAAGELQEEKPEMSQRDKEALELGRRVLAVQDAIREPGKEGSLKAVTELGHDQRHYVMVRGWLGFLLQAEESVQRASQGDVAAEKQERIDFLRRSIRAIDLE